jgi:hypothetical protein
MYLKILLVEGDPGQSMFSGSESADFELRHEQIITRDDRGHAQSAWDWPEGCRRSGSVGSNDEGRISRDLMPRYLPAKRYKMNCRFYSPNET